jgi:hypothetical protein
LQWNTRKVKSYDLRLTEMIDVLAVGPIQWTLSGIILVCWFIERGVVTESAVFIAAYHERVYALLF